MNRVSLAVYSNVNEYFKEADVMWEIESLLLFHIINISDKKRIIYTTVIPV